MELPADMVDKKPETDEDTRLILFCQYNQLQEIGASMDTQHDSSIKA